MKERVLILRESVVKMTQILVGQGIQVTQRGVSAYVRADAKTGKPELVNLPFIPDNAEDDLIDAIQGFLDHECAHILFSDFNVIGEAKKAGCASMHNLLEDIRIEQAMAKRFQGTADNLARMGDFFLRKYTKPKMDEAVASGDDQLLTSVLMVPLMRALGGQRVFQEFIDDKIGYVQEAHDALKDLAPKIAAMSSTKDALDVAKIVVDRLKALSEPPEEEAPGSASASGEGSGTGAGKGSGGGTGDGEGRKAHPTRPEEEKKDEDEEAGAAKDEESDDDDDDEKDDEGDGDDESEQGETESDTRSGTSISWEKIDKETARGFDEEVSNLITGGAADAAKAADYTVFTTDFDVIEPLHVGGGYSPDMLKRMQESVDHMVGPMQKDLERAIAARSLATWSPGHRSGRINPTALHRLPAGDDRVFRRRLEVTSKDVAVELVCDISGSMSGEKIHTAGKAAYALASVLERIGIKSEVICFTTGAAIPDPKMAEEEKRLGIMYSRHEALYMPILKSFNERMTPDIKQRFAWMPNMRDLRNNVDGESILVAGRRLLSRRENGKVMMVLSDGAPSAYGACEELAGHLKMSVQSLTNMGVTTVGIGINSAEVRKFYPKSMVLNNVGELPALVMRELRQLLVS